MGVTDDTMNAWLAQQNQPQERTLNGNMGMNWQGNAPFNTDSLNTNFYQGNGFGQQQQPFDTGSIGQTDYPGNGFGQGNMPYRAFNDPQGGNNWGAPAMPGYITPSWQNKNRPPTEDELKQAGWNPNNEFNYNEVLQGKSQYYTPPGQTTFYSQEEALANAPDWYRGGQGSLGSNGDGTYTFRQDNPMKFTSEFPDYRQQPGMSNMGRSLPQPDNGQAFSQSIFTRDLNSEANRNNPQALAALNALATGRASSPFMDAQGAQNQLRSWQMEGQGFKLEPPNPQNGYGARWHDPRTGDVYDYASGNKVGNDNEMAAIMAAARQKAMLPPPRQAMTTGRPVYGGGNVPNRAPVTPTQAALSNAGNAAVQFMRNAQRPAPPPAAAPALNNAGNAASALLQNLLNQAPQGRRSPDSYDWSR